MWYVILFLKENKVAVAPSSWYVSESKECFWPPNSWTAASIRKCIKLKSSPEHDWQAYQATTLGKYAHFEVALQKQIKAQHSDKLTTTDDESLGKGKRKRAVNPIFTNSDSGDDDNTSSHESDESLSFPKVPEPVVSLLNEDRDMDVYPSEKSNKKVSRGQTLRRIRSRSLSPRFGRDPTSENFCSVTLASELRERAKVTKPTVSERSGKVAPDMTFFSNTLEERFCNFNSTEKEEYGQESTNNTTYRIRNQSEGNQILMLLQTIQQENAEFRMSVLRKLNLINMRVNDVQNAIETLSNNLDSNEQSENVDGLKLKEDTFPLINENDLSQLEELLQNQMNKKSLAMDLARTGGVDVKDIIRRLMYKMFSNDLGELFSWDGAKRKRKFKELKISGVIIDAVRLNKPTKDATDVEIITCIKKWLVRCKDRKVITLKKNIPGDAIEVNPEN